MKVKITKQKKKVVLPDQIMSCEVCVFSNLEELSCGDPKKYCSIWQYCYCPSQESGDDM